MWSCTCTCTADIDGADPYPIEVQSSMYVMGWRRHIGSRGVQRSSATHAGMRQLELLTECSEGYRIFVFSRMCRARPKADPGKRVDSDRTPATGFDVA